MEETINPTPAQAPEIGEQPDQVKKKSPNYAVIAVAMFLLLVLFGLVGYIIFFSNKSTEDKKTIKTTTAVTVNDNTTATTSNTTTEADPYEGWKTYENPKYKYSFKYPSDWGIDTVNANLAENAVVTLNKDNNDLMMWVKLSGVGGTPINDCHNESDITTEKFTVDGIEIFKHIYRAALLKETCQLIQPVDDSLYKVVYTDTEYSSFIGTSGNLTSLLGNIYASDEEDLNDVVELYDKIVKSIEWGDVFK